MTVLVDADNVTPARLQPVLDLLARVAPTSTLMASGHRGALGRLRWPDGARLLAASGWQQADIRLATAYSPSPEPLILVSGDGDFALLATRHPGPVLVVSGSPSARLREVGVVVDPAADGVGPIAEWLRAHGVPGR